MADYLFHPGDVKNIIESYNTGAKAIILCQDILNFDEIYLIGFDFHTRVIEGKEQSHFYGDEVGHNKKYLDDTRLKNHINRLNKMVTEFEVIKDTSNIFNCYKNSKLKRFPYGMPSIT